MSGPLAPFIGMSIASVITAFVLVSIVEKLFGLVGIARVAVFGGIWSAVTTLAGMRSLTGKARKLRAKNARVMKTLKGDK